MKKILIALILLVMTMPTALAVTRDDAAAAALEAVGAEAELVRTSLEDGVYDVTLRSADANYEVEILDATGAVLEIETVFPAAGRGASFALTEEQALEAAKALLPENGEGAALALAHRDDGACEYEIFYAAADAIIKIDVNAETGALVKTKTYPQAVEQGILTLAQVKQLIQDKGGEITEIDLEWDHGRYEFSGEATVSGARYDFEIEASTGSFLEWERD